MPKLLRIKYNSELKQNVLLVIPIVILTYFISYILLFRLWVVENQFLHNSIELFGIFLMFFAFVHTMSTYSDTNRFVHLVGFWAFTVAILSLPHIAKFVDLLRIPNYINSSAMDISLKYGVLLRYFELFILFLIGFCRKDCRVKRRSGMMFSVFAIILSLLLAYYTVYSMPSYYDSTRITMHKRNSDLLLVFFAACLVVFYKNRYGKSNEERDKIMNKYIALSMVIFIFSSISFAVSEEVTSAAQFMGHLLKLIHIGLIYYGVYKVTIEYPYKRERKIKGFYESLLDTSPFGFITFDLSGKISYISKKCDILFDYDMRKLNGMTIDKFVDLIDIIGYSRNELIETLGKLKGGMINFYGQPILSKDRSRKLVFSVMESELGCVFEVRDAKKSQAVKNMQLQTQTLLDSTDSLALILDTDKKVVMCNKKFLRVTGISMDTVLGLGFMELSELFNTNLKNEIHKNINNGQHMKSVLWCIQTKDGENKKLSLDSSTIYDVDDEEIGWIILGRDVSGYEKEQEKIIHREKMAIIGQMAAGLVHEIKNPLASIKGLCQLMRSRAKPEKVLDYSIVMENAVDDIGEIVSNFLHFSKPAIGGFEEVSVNTLVSSLEMLISSNTYKNGIKTRFMYSEKEALVLLNEHQIKNIILSIVDNAIEAMNGGIDPRLLIATYYNPAKNNMNISIKDNGMGMTEEQLACVGTPFYTTKAKGTGLGISMCKYVVESHGGELRIESRLGEGSLFTVILPCTIGK